MMLDLHLAMVAAGLAGGIPSVVARAGTPHGSARRARLASSPTSPKEAAAVALPQDEDLVRFIRVAQRSGLRAHELLDASPALPHGACSAATG